MSLVNPDTGRVQKVAEDSIEATTWPTRAEWKRDEAKRKKQRKQIEDAATKALERAVTSEQGQRVQQRIADTARAGATRIAATAGAATAGVGRAVALGRGGAGAGIAALGAGGTAAAVGAAFAVGYGIGTAGLKLWQYLQPEERDYRKAIAFRKAREEFAKKHGRPMTLEEVRAMGRGYLDSLSKR